MRNMKERIAGLLVCLALLAPSPLLAGDDGKEEGVSPGERPKEENPLETIIELMRQVEEKLAEADLGDGTLSEMDRIERALDPEGRQNKIDEAKKAESEVTQAIDRAMQEQERVVKALEELIRKAEESP